MLLQIFILINVFLAGAAIALAGWYAYQHTHSKKADVEEKHEESNIPIMPRTTRQRLLHTAETQFELIVDHAADELQFDLKETSDGLSGRLKSLGNEIVDTELKRYKASLEELRQQTETSIGDAAAEVAKHQAELQQALKTRLQQLETALAEDMAAEKKRLADQMDAKLAGAVTAFLVETLGHNVDLGAQAQYLTETLEQHKAELIKEIQDES
jgi:hypothetical protein